MAPDQRHLRALRQGRHDDRHRVGRRTRPLRVPKGPRRVGRGLRDVGLGQPVRGAGEAPLEPRMGRPVEPIRRHDRTVRQGPRHGRRLADKLLAAFNHAYAMGEKQLARALWDCLLQAEELGQHFNRRPANEALELAADWIAFVDARDRYREASKSPVRSPDEASEAYRAMRSAYQSWRARNLSADQSPESLAASLREYRDPS